MRYAKNTLQNKVKFIVILGGLMEEKIINPK